MTLASCHLVPTDACKIAAVALLICMVRDGGALEISNGFLRIYVFRLACRTVEFLTCLRKEMQIVEM